ncbi:MAG: metallophosphoesterase [Methylothermaceae bacterium]|nr:metallophosphoesterase [Methylothermaceae bacterium]
MRLHYFSDIHLEFGGMRLPKVDADVIVAAGDIGVGLQGLRWLSRQGRPVVYVAGNHEFYKHEHGTLLAQLELAALDGPVHFLENRSEVIDGVRFLGCTLWTDLGGGDEDVAALADSLNDFHKIRFGNGPFRLEHYRMLHQASRDWLEKSLQIPFAGPTVVVTHHAPSFWSWDHRPSALNRFAYCNDLRELMYEHEITAWFHGHTHVARDYRCADTRVLCNPRGYFYQRLVDEFRPDGVIEL